MKRLTEKVEGGYRVPAEEMEQAIQRLGQFEDAYDDLLARQAQIPTELERLRTQGKEKTVAYKELLAQKLVNNHIVMFFERHKLKYDDRGDPA